MLAEFAPFTIVLSVAVIAGCTPQGDAWPADLVLGPGILTGASVATAWHHSCSRVGRVAPLPGCRAQTAPAWAGCDGTSRPATAGSSAHRPSRCFGAIRTPRAAAWHRFCRAQPHRFAWCPRLEATAGTRGARMRRERDRCCRVIGGAAPSVALVQPHQHAVAQHVHRHGLRRPIHAVRPAPRGSAAPRSEACTVLARGDGACGRVKCSARRWQGASPRVPLDPSGCGLRHEATRGEVRLC
jgi:hypothetical protein